MGASFEVVQPGMVKILLAYDGKDGLGIPIDKARNIIEGSALYNWLDGLGPPHPDPQGPTDIQKPWEDLTDQEKLTMVFKAAKRVIEDQAIAGYVGAQERQARDAALEYANEEFDLG